MELIEEMGEKYETKFDPNDPCGIFDIQNLKSPLINIQRQVYNGREIFSAPTPKFLSQHNRVIHGKMTDEERKKMSEEIRKEIEDEWGSSISRKDQLSQPVDVPNIIKLQKNYDDLSKRLLQAEEKLKHVQLSGKNHRSRFRKKRARWDAPKEINLPKQLEGWRYDSINAIDEKSIVNRKDYKVVQTKKLCSEIAPIIQKLKSPGMSQVTPVTSPQDSEGQIISQGQIPVKVKGLDDQKAMRWEWNFLTQQGIDFITKKTDKDWDFHLKPAFSTRNSPMCMMLEFVKNEISKKYSEEAFINSGVVIIEKFNGAKLIFFPQKDDSEEGFTWIRCLPYNENSE